jgi:hypothetical protein
MRGLTFSQCFDEKMTKVQSRMNGDAAKPKTLPQAIAYNPDLNHQSDSDSCRALHYVVVLGPLPAHLKGEMPAVIGGPMLLDEVERENAEERIRKTGPGAELVRKRELERFDLSVKALRARASLADIVAFNRAVDWWHHSHGSSECATLVEAILAVLGVEIKVD